MTGRCRVCGKATPFTVSILGHELDACPEHALELAAASATADARRQEIHADARQARDFRRLLRATAYAAICGAALALGFHDREGWILVGVAAGVALTATLAQRTWTNRPRP